MTVPSSLSRYQYQGNGVTRAFALPIVLTSLADIGVQVFDTAANQDVTPSSGYAVAGAQDAASGEYLSGATVTFTLAPTGSQIVTLWRQPPLTQLADFEPNDPLPAATLDLALDKQMMVAQRLDDRLVRAVRAPLSDPPAPNNPDMHLPGVALRAGMLLSFDVLGRPAAAAPGGAYTSGNFVANMAALRLVAGTAGAQAMLTGYYTAGDKRPVLYTWQAADSRADDGGLVVKPNGVSGAGRWVLATAGAPYNLIDWGADPQGVVLSDNPMAHWFAALVANGAAGYMPAGNYKFLNRITWDMTGLEGSGLRIHGDGSAQTVLDVSASTTAPGLGVTGSAQINHLDLRGFKVVADTAGQALQLGAPDFSSPIHSGLVEDVSAANSSTGSAAAGIEINGIFNCRLFVQANCGGTGGGVAMRVREMEMCLIGGIFSNAQYGIAFNDGAGQSSVFVGCAISTVATAVLAGAGSSAARNTFVGCNFGWTVATFQMNEAVGYFRAIGCFFQGGAVVSAGAAQGQVIVEDTGPIGLFGADAAEQPAVTGSRGGNAALQSLLTGLASYGAVIDRSTA